MNPETKETTVKTIAGLPSGASLADARSSVAEACRVLGLSPPSKATIWKLLMQARHGRQSSADEGLTIPGRCRLRLPMKDHGATTLPLLAIAV